MLKLNKTVSKAGIKFPVTDKLLSLIDPAGEFSFIIARLF